MKRGDSTEPVGSSIGLFQLHPALDALSTFIYVKDRGLRIVSVNRSYCEALGVARGGLLGKPTEPLLGEDGPASARVDREVIESGTPRRGIVERLVATDGLHWVVTDKAPIRGPDGSVVGLLGTSIDITAQRKAEKDLQRAEKHLSILTEHMADNLWTLDLNLNTTYVSASIERVLGFTPEERKRMKLEELATPESVSRIVSEFQRELQQEQSGADEPDRSVNIDVEYYHKNGSTVWMENVVQAIRSPDGAIIGLLGVSRDITERRKGEEALREQRMVTEQVLERALAGYWDWDIPAGKEYLSPAFKRMFGYEDHELPNVPESWQRLAFAEDLARLFDHLQQHFASHGEAPLSCEMRYRHRDGSTVWVLCTGRVIAWDTDDKPLRMVGCHVDITGQKQAEYALAQSEAHVRFLTQNMADILWTMDMGLHTTYISPSVERVLGFTPEEYVLRPIDRMVTPESLSNIRSLMQQQLALEELETADPQRTITLEAQYYHKDGTTVSLEQVVQITRDEGGKPTGIFGVARDVTTRKQAERALAESEARLRFLTENAADVIWTMDMEFHTTYISPSVERVLGFTPEEWVQLPFDRMSTAESVQREYAELRQQLELEADGTADPNRTLTIAVEMNHKDGSTVWMEMVIRALRDDAGTLVGLIGVSRDITSRKKAEEALRRSEEKYHALFELSKDAGYLASLDGRFLEVNQAWVDLFGYSRREASNLRVEDIYEDPRVRSERFLPGTAQEGEIVDWEVRFKKKDGTVMDCVCSVVARRDSSGAIICLQGMVRDITEQRRAQLGLRESEEKFRALFEQSMDAIALVNPDGRILEANQAFLDLFGYTAAEIVDFDSTQMYVAPDGQSRFLEMIAESGVLVDDEVQLRRKDGTVMDCLRTVTVRRDTDGNVEGYQPVICSLPR